MYEIFKEWFAPPPNMPDFQYCIRTLRQIFENEGLLQVFGTLLYRLLNSQPPASIKLKSSNLQVFLNN